MSLVDQAKSVICKRPSKTFLDKLPPASAAEVVALVDAYLAGELKGDWNIAELYRRILVPNGYTFSDQIFRRWVKQYAEKRKDAADRASEERPAKERKAGAKR